MNHILPVKALLPANHKRITGDEHPLCSIYRFQAFRLQSARRDPVSAGIEFLLQSEQDEQILIYCILPEPGLISRIKWFSEEVRDEEMCSYLIKAFIQKYLSKRYCIRLKH
jgi:hypothetical protein